MLIKIILLTENAYNEDARHVHGKVMQRGRPWKEISAQSEASVNVLAIHSKHCAFVC
jgi:hypothetical protein